MEEETIGAFWGPKPMRIGAADCRGPMEAILRAEPDLAITRKPGHMLITDMRDEAFRHMPI